MDHSPVRDGACLQASHTLKYQTPREAMTSNLNCLGAFLILLLLSHPLLIKALKMMDGNLFRRKPHFAWAWGTRLKAV
jgi:hypothetical protein